MPLPRFAAHRGLSSVAGLCLVSLAIAACGSSGPSPSPSPSASAGPVASAGTGPAAISLPALGSTITVPAGLSPNANTPVGPAIHSLDAAGHDRQIMAIGGGTGVEAPTLAAFRLSATDEKSAIASLLNMISPTGKGQLLPGDPAPLGSVAGRRVSGQIELGPNLPTVQIEAVLAVQNGSASGLVLACPLAPAPSGNANPSAVPLAGCDVTGLLAAAASIKPIGK